MLKKEWIQYAYYKNLCNIPELSVEEAIHTFDILSKSVNYYEENLKNKKYIISLSDGNKLEFEIFENNLAHVLGILTLKFYAPKDKVYSNEIIGLTPKRSISSFQLLKRMIEKKEDIIKYEYETGNNNVNFYRILLKNEVFKNTMKLNEFSYGIVNFNSDIYQKINHIRTQIKSNKLLIFPTENDFSFYSFLGIKTDKFNILETAIMALLEQDFLSNQHISFPIKIEKTDKNGKKELCKEITLEEKIKFLEFYKYLSLNSKREIKLDINGYPRIIIQKRQTF